MATITGLRARLLFNSRGSKTIEVDIGVEYKHWGRACAPSGASVGAHEAVSFPDGGPEKALRVLLDNINEFDSVDAGDPRAVRDAIKQFDDTDGYQKVGGAVAYAVSIAAAEANAEYENVPLLQSITKRRKYQAPYPLGNILGGGAHAGPGTPDIQEILVCATGAKTVTESIETNLAVHRELRKILEQRDGSFTNGRGDEGGWAPKMDNKTALECSAKAIESLGFEMGQEVSLGVDFASSTQWDNTNQKYNYARAGFENDAKEQIEFASDIISTYKLLYAEDAVHEEAFEDMAELTRRFPDTMIVGDDLTVTNTRMLQKAINTKSCNAAILKVNQAGTLCDALEFAEMANGAGIGLATSHRSGESNDSHITHIGLATDSKLLKVGVVGGERVAKLNELVRLDGQGLIRGMVAIPK